MKITFQKNRYDKSTSLSQDIEWGDFCDAVSTHTIREEKDGLCFVPSTFEPTCSCGKCSGAGHALKNNVVSYNMLALDLDKSKDGGDLGHDEALRTLIHLESLGLDCMVYSTHSYAPPLKSTWRVFVRLSRPVLKSEFIDFWRGAVEFLGITSGVKTDNPARLWYLPSCPPDGAEPQRCRFEGDALDVDEILSKSTRVVEVVEHEEISFGPAPQKLIEFVSEILSESGQAVEGDGGNTKTYSNAMLMLHDYALTQEEAWPIFKKWNTQNEPPWSEIDLSLKLMAEPNLNRQYGQSRIEWEFCEGLLESIQPDPGSWEHYYKEAEKDLKEALEIEDAEHSTTPKPFFMPWNQLRDTEFKETPWLVDKLITVGEIASISTEPKAAKTWLATEIAVSVALGSKACGEFQCEKAGVAYFYAEDMGQAIKTRVSALMKNHTNGRDCENLFLQPRGRELDLTVDSSLATLLASIRKYCPNTKLVILDPLRDVHSAKEDSSDEMSQVTKRMRILSKLLECTVLYVHHSAKASADTNSRSQGGQRMRGSGALHGATGCNISMFSPGGNGKDLFTAKVKSEVKSAKGAGYFSLSLQLTDSSEGFAETAEWDVSYGEEEEVDESVTEVIEAIGESERRHEPPQTAKEICKVVKGGRAKIDRSLMIAFDQGYLEKYTVCGAQKGWELSTTGKQLFSELSADNIDSS